jgi:hypothetical protein
LTVRANRVIYAGRTFGDLGGAIGRLNQHISALGSKCGGDSSGEGVNALEKSGTALDAELELLENASC